MKKIGQYQNGNYKVVLFDDGTKIRWNNLDYMQPSFPENIDLMISTKCDNNCGYCYAGCSLYGEHGRLIGEDGKLAWHFLETLRPYTELAININNPVPLDLTEFLYKMKEKMVIVNATVNQNHFMKDGFHEMLKAFTEAGLIHGLGISLTDPSMDFIERVREFPNAVIHVINGIVMRGELLLLRDRGLKILILGYKRKNRGVGYYDALSPIINHRFKYLAETMPRILSEGWFDVVSFDNLALEQLNIKSLIPDKQWDSFYMGDDGSFTMAANLVTGTFAPDSLSLTEYNIGNKSIDEMFQIIRECRNDEK